MRASRWIIGIGVAVLIAAAFAARFGPYVYHRYIHPDVQGIGGCVLVYEIDRQRSPGPDSRDELVAALRKRLSSAGLTRAEVRPVGTDRVQIEVLRPDPRTSGDLRDEVALVKELATLVGRLEFRIVANNVDDADAIAQAQAYIDGGGHQAELDRAARDGTPPPPPPVEGAHTVVRADGTRAFQTAKGAFTYSWAELGPEEERSLHLDAQAQHDPLWGTCWRAVAERRNRTVPPTTAGAPFWSTLLYSRDCQDQSLSDDARKNKGPEYFLLLRDPELDTKTGKPARIDRSHLRRVRPGMTPAMQPCVDFVLDKEGGDLFYALTSKNAPSGAGDDGFYRHLAIVIDGKVLTAPNLNEPIRMHGQISGSFTHVRVLGIVTVLQGDALPAVLKPVPVSETFLGEEPQPEEPPRRSKLFEISD
jgi:preprotein translocase subunit SecD